MTKTIIALLLFIGVVRTAQAGEIPWTVQELIHGGRIDAIAYAGNHVVICGTRGPNPGWIFYSIDNGVTWHKGQHLDSQEKLTGVTCIACAKNGLCFAINESSELYRSPDYGKTWTRLGRVTSNGAGYIGAHSYGLCVTKQGTLLISDTNKDGGYVFRSTDNGDTFTKIGPVSSRALYRFDQVRDGVVVNGWAGSVYKSADDGLSWQLFAKMDSTALYATEYMLPTTIVQASEAGYVYTADIDGHGKFRNMSKPGGAADDFVYLGYHTLIYTTYTKSRSVFISYDEGKTWTDDGVVPTGVPGDWLDHVISLELGDSVIAIGGTHYGFILRAAYARSALYAKTLDPQKRTYDPAYTRDLEKGLVGSLFDPIELNEPEDVLIDGSVAYVPCRGSNNVAVIDIARPEKPALLSSFRDPELMDAMCVAKHGKYLYITSMSNHKCVVADASDPHHLRRLYAFTVGHQPNLRKVVYKDGYLYLTHDGEGRLYIADTRDPARPEIVGNIATGDGAFGVFVQGNIAYVGGCFPPGFTASSLKVIDVADKKHPRLLSTIADSARYGCTCDFQRLGNKLVDVAYSSNALAVFDLSSPGHPVEEGFLQTRQLLGPGRVRVIGTKAYVINSINDCFAEVDLQVPGAPKLDYVVPSWKLKKVYGMDVKAGLLYLAGRDSRYFLVVDPRKY